MQGILDDLQDPRQLGARLTKAIGPLRIRRAIVGLSTADFSVTAAAGNDVPAGAGPGLGEEFPIRIGCLVKLFTATLVLDAVFDGLIDLDDPVSEYLPELSGRLAHLETVKIRHLLEHTHGIDDSLLGTYRPECSPRIDPRSFSQWLAVPALTSPGQLYSYSHLGGLLLGAILERRLGQSYTDIQAARLLGPARVQPRSAAGQPLHGGYSISPSFEGELSLSAGELMRLLGHCARSSLRRCSRTVTDLPGWNAVERGICFGWKAYGDDWFGHASDLREHLTIAKVHPESGVVLLVSSPDCAPSAIMSAVFGDLLPRCHQLRLPRTLNAQERSDLDFDRYIDDYENAAVAVSLTRDDPDALLIKIGNRSRSVDVLSPELSSKALPARDNLFVCRSAAGDFGVFQFVSPDETGFRFLWNGKAILGRRQLRQAGPHCTENARC